MIDGIIKNTSKSAAGRTKVVSNQVHHRTQQARTLMRGGLKKPLHQPAPAVSHTAGFDPAREIRAKKTPKHHNVQRFGIPAAASKPAVQALRGEIVRRPSPKSSEHAAPAAPLPSMITSTSHQKLERMLDQALTHADTHKEALRYHAARHFWQRRGISGRRRWLALGLSVIFLFILLFVSYQKIPQVSVKAAGMRAHLSPAVPTYIPDSYKMAGPAKADSGTVKIKYVSSSNTGASYNIVESQSNLTSQLVEQSVVPKGASVQTSQVNGNTVYIYGRGNDAAWVNNGILYTVKDNANLSSDELIKIVQGLNP